MTGYLVEYLIDRKPLIFLLNAFTFIGFTKPKDNYSSLTKKLYIVYNILLYYKYTYLYFISLIKIA